MQLNINHSAVVSFTNKLEKMKRSALPNAVRNSLNSTAFDVKKNTMPKAAKTSFKKKHEGNFYKANSHVEMAKGWDIKSMRSTVGFISERLKGNNNYSVKDLEEQEFGGSIGSRSFIPLKTARSSKSKPVRPENRISTIKPHLGNTIAAGKVKHKSGKQRFIRAAIKAKSLYGDNAYVLGNSRNGGWRTLSRIDSVFKESSGKIKITRTPLYTFKKNFRAPVKGKRFMERAAHESGLRINQHFINAARREFDKIK